MGEKITVPGDVTTEFEILGEKEFTVKRTQDVSPIIDQNKRDQNDSDFRNGMFLSGDMQHVARIPIIMLELWAEEAGIPKNQCLGPKMNDIIRRKLNDPDNEFLRTGRGRI